MNKQRSPPLSCSHILYSLTATSPWQQCPTGYTWGKQRENRRERERERKFLLGSANLAEALTGITCADLLTESFGFFPPSWPAATPRSHDNCIPRFTGCLLGSPLANSQTVIINTDDATLPSVLGGVGGVV
ncbi:hypothetical protein PBY51_015605 [Eleginops maclovinus]|uniref:Uncharacterized protein n=1 Tax=Eleginops maclovinus TaxID=56733 RepID=A0AAN8AIX6_ELEMC|nr:hypothetical protein PBY51_015605 [Eleginops maclovinus]